jgi:flavin reductase (DIM6/NTAB) family NADH-FMN oxidoreductase RutF
MRPGTRHRARKRSLPLARVYRLLEPGPVVLLTTCARGRLDVMPMSWYTMIEFEPPLVGCVISDRNHSFRAVQATGECVLNIPTSELVRAVVRCGNTSGRTVDKFRAFGLTPVAAARVRAPLVDECYASLEARVIDARMVRRYGLFVLEVVQAWIDPNVKRPRTLHHRGRGEFMVAGEIIRLRSGKR